MLHYKRPARRANALSAKPAALRCPAPSVAGGLPVRASSDHSYEVLRAKAGGLLVRASSVLVRCSELWDSGVLEHALG